MRSSTRSIVAANERRHLTRETTLRLALGIFVVMAVASSYISWSSQHIIEVMYREALTLLPPDGPVPPFPLDTSSALTILRNMIVYVVLIGSLLAIIIGNVIGTRDKRARTLRVLFARPITKRDFFLGKVAASSQALAVITLFAFATSAVSLLLVTRTFTLSWLAAMLAFYGAAYLFMSGFGLLALGVGLREQRSAQALLKPIVVWIIVIFALPELGSALYPTSSLNPVLPPTDVLQSPALTLVHNLVYPFSISEQFKGLTASLIGIAPPADAVGAIGYSPWLQAALLLAWAGLTLLLAYTYAMKLDVSRDDYE